MPPFLRLTVFLSLLGAPALAQVKTAAVPLVLGPQLPVLAVPLLQTSPLAGTALLLPVRLETAPIRLLPAVPGAALRPIAAAVAAAYPAAAAPAPIHALPAAAAKAAEPAARARASLESMARMLVPALHAEASEGKTLSDRAFDLTPRAQAVVDAALDAGVPAEHFVEIEGIPPFLTVADPDDRAWLAKTLGKAARTRVGRSVLRRAAAVAARRGRPVPVQVEELRSENGSFVYDWEVLQLARSLVRDDAPEAAAIIVHELLHFVQRDIGLPSDALEMELEAHIVTLQVFRQLGAKVPRASFSYGFEQALLRGGAPEVIEWLAGQYGENIGLLNDGSVEKYISTLEKRRKLRLKDVAKTEKLVARREAVLADLRAAGHPAKVLESYDHDQLAPLREKIRSARTLLEWIERDLAILRDPAGAERYRAFSRRVLKRIERYHRLIAG
ncbi:MAG: hypothetical protein WC969_11515 [Elusimicrobiota bacterium]|jgi:hypothetical protein